VLEGCKVGCRSVVGAGAVVTHSLPSDTACIGIPARAIRRLTTESSGED
jgi:acetyltransferase-like isoleucine patch superfamily enzyme